MVVNVVTAWWALVAVALAIVAIGKVWEYLKAKRELDTFLSWFVLSAVGIVVLGISATWPVSLPIGVLWQLRKRTVQPGRVE